MDPQLVREIIFFYFAYVFCGILSVALNIIVVGSLIVVKALQKQRWLMLSASLIVADSMLSFGYGIPSVVGIDRYLNQHIVNNVSVAVAVYTNLECMGINLWQISFTLFDQLIVLSIAIERVFALTMTMWYFENSDKLVKGLLISSGFVAIIITICSFIGVNTNAVSCGINEGFNYYFKRFYYIFITCLCGLVVLVYSFVLCITHNEVRKLKLYQPEKSSEHNSKAKQMTKQLKITKVITLIVLAYLVTTVPAYVMTLLLIFVPTIISDSTTKIRVMLSCQLLITLNTFLNSFLYTWRNDDIRDGIRQTGRKLFGTWVTKRTSTVQLTSKHNHTITHVL